MSGDIKALVVEVKNINGSVQDTKKRFDVHENESGEFRKKVTELWAGIHFTKWVIATVLASGIMWHIFRKWFE